MRTLLNHQWLLIAALTSTGGALLGRAQFGERVGRFDPAVALSWRGGACVTGSGDCWVTSLVPCDVAAGCEGIECELPGGPCPAAEAHYPNSNSGLKHTVQPCTVGQAGTSEWTTYCYTIRACTHCKRGMFGLTCEGEEGVGQIDYSDDAAHMGSKSSGPGCPSSGG